MKKNKGITLVALVITIIILLILAGITISQLSGSGLFENAKLAEQKSKEAQEKEEGILKDYENKIADITSTRNESLGGFKLIWTNANVSDDFSDQTIEYDLSGYDYVLIQTAYTAGYQGYYPETQYSLIPVGSSGKIMGIDDSVAFHAVRTVNVSNTGISFSKADTISYNVGSSSNSVVHGKPLKIYAIKE